MIFFPLGLIAACSDPAPCVHQMHPLASLYPFPVPGAELGVQRIDGVGIEASRAGLHGLASRSGLDI